MDWYNGKLGDDSWSPQTFDFSLRMALIYPLISLFAIWVATGENTSGIDALLPPASAAQRLLALFAIAVSIFSYLQYMRASSWIGRISWLIITVAFGVAGAVAFAGAGAVAFAGAGAGAMMFILFFLKIRGMQSISHIVLVGYAVLVVVVVVAWQPSEKPENYALLIYFVTLPVVNAIFDWLSIGATRYLLRQGYESRWGLLFGVIDMFVAAAFLTVLAVTTIAVVQGLNLLALAYGANVPIVDIAGILERLRTNPGDPALYWIYIVVFSTFLPSFVHAMLATPSLLGTTFISSWLSHTYRDLMESEARAIKEDDPDKRKLKGNLKRMRWCAAVLTVYQVEIALVVLVFLAALFVIPTMLGFLFWQHIGANLLWLCEITLYLLTPR